MINTNTRTKQPSARSIAVLALIESGVRDHAVIATALGLNKKQVAQIDMAPDRTLRHLAVRGVPDDFTFRLSQRIRCPRCGQQITVAPCLTCRSAKAIEVFERNKPH